MDGEDLKLILLVLAAGAMLYCVKEVPGCQVKTARAGASCEAIKDHDRRHYCRAVTDKAPSWCEFIRDNDLRILCRVQAKK